jgi:Domain of unknown function (DUF4345)
MSRLVLQICTALLALIPIARGIVSMLGPEAPVLDSNLRFFWGVCLGIGLAMLWLVPSIERQGTLFRALWGAGPVPRQTVIDRDSLS